MEFWTNDLGSAMWVYDTSAAQPWRNLSTGEYSLRKPSGAASSFIPSGPYDQSEADLFPYASRYVTGFPRATGARAIDPPLSSAPSPTAESVRQRTGAPSAPSAAPVAGQVPPLNPDDFYVRWDDAVGGYVPARAGEAGAIFDNEAWAAASKARSDIARGFAPAGAAGPTAAELAIERSKVQAQNLATFVSGTIAELESEIDAKRLSTEQAIGEFNRRLDAFSEAGSQFQGIQPYTIPIGAEYVPGRQPGGIGERLGIAPSKAEVIQFDPFAMASQIVEETPVLTDIGVPSTDALSEAIELARGLAGG